MANELDTVFENFESAWARDETPVLSEFLPAAGSPRRLEALLELIRIDLEFRWRNAASSGVRGGDEEPWSLNDYAGSFPELTVAEMVTSGLIAEEYRVRLRWGDRPDRVEFASRFDVEPEQVLPQLRAVDAELADERTNPSFDETVLPNLANEPKTTSDLPEYTAANVDESKSTDSQPQQFGEYELLHEVARGGMGVVYKARHRTMDRVVALKVISPNAMDSQPAIDRFLREVRVAAKLSHPNIVTAFDAGKNDDTHFLVMEFVEGEDLSRLLRKWGRFEVAAAVDFIRQTARGLEYAHQRGIVHRDIKPGNLLLDDSGCVKILDMGLARTEGNRDNQERELTHTGAVMGTVDFMSPEQAKDSKSADARADIYSLGCTMYYVLTGKAIYDGDSVIERLLAHRDQPIPSLGETRDDVAAELDAVFRKMVAKDREDRYQSMADVLEDLDAVPVNVRAEYPTMVGSSAASTRGSSPTMANSPPAELANVGDSAEATRRGETLASSNFGDTLVGSFIKRFREQRTSQPWWRNRLLLAAAGMAALLILGTVLILMQWNTPEPDPEAGSTSGNGANRIQSPGPARKDPATDPDRDVAKWLLSVGGHVGVETNAGQFRNRISVPANLPVEPFRIRAIELTNVKKLADDDLARFRNIHDLAEFSLTRSEIGDAGVGHLSHLTKMTHLMLHTTRVTDQGMRAFAGLKGLTSLSLTMNTAVSDAGIRQLPKSIPLEKLGLEETPVTGASLRHFENLRELKKLGIGHSKILNSDLQQLARAPKLESLAVDGNQVVGEGSKHIAKLKSLRSLNIGFRDTRQPDLNFLAQMQHLTDLSLHNGVTISQLKVVARMPNLKTLHLHYNGDVVSDGLLASFTWPKKLTVLKLTGSRKVTDAGITKLFGLKTLQSLDLLDTSVSDRGAAQLSAELPGCKIIWGTLQAPKTIGGDAEREVAKWVLSVGGTVNVTTKADSFRNLKDLAKLPAEAFQVGAINLTDVKKLADQDLARLRTIQGVSRFILVRSEVGDAGVAHLSHLTQMNRLSIQATRITDQGMRAFAGMTRLSVLRLGGYDVSDAGIRHLSRSVPLTVLNIHEMPVTVATLEHFQNLGELTMLDISNTKIGGNDLAQLARTPKLVHLTIDGNQAAGDGGKHIAKLKSLRSLLIGFRGTKTHDLSFLARMPQLEQLGLGHGVSGSQLKVISQMPNLKTLGLSYNPNVVSDAVLDSLGLPKNLTKLALAGDRKITDAGLATLFELKKLKSLDLRGTSATARGVAKLSAKLPGCKIEWGSQEAPKTIGGDAKRDGAK